MKFILPIMLLTQGIFAETLTQEFDIAGLKGLEIDAHSGSVMIQASSDQKVKVVATKKDFSEKCRLTMEKKDDEIEINVKKTGLFSRAECEVDFEIQVPRMVDLDVEMGSGNLTVRGVEGELDFKVGSGQVTADGVFRKVDGKSGSGDLSIRGLSGGGELKAGSGNIDLTFATSNLKGEMDIKTGSGNATVSLPKGTSVNSNLKAGSGTMTNEMKNDPNAPFKVSMKAGSGNLIIRAL